jgi:Fe2+ transport system protein B
MIIKTKKTIILKIISFLLISLMFLVMSYVVSNTASAQNSGATLVIPPTKLPNNSGGIKAILENVLKWILGIFGVIAIISFVVSGIQYFMAAGDEKNMDTAKRNMTYSIIGIIVALASFVIIQAIDAALRGNTVF